MKKMLLALTMFGLVGCHTMADLRAQKPEASLHLTKLLMKFHSVFFSDGKK